MTSEEIQIIFFVECEESLAAAEAGLAACEAGTHDAETINGIFRAVHSIKGGGGAFGFAALQTFAHCLETLLADVREEKLAITGTLVKLLLRSLDTLSDHVGAARDGGVEPDDAALLIELTGALADSGKAVNADPEPAPTPVANNIDTECARQEDDLGFDLDALLDELAGETMPAVPSETEGWQVLIRPHAGAMRNGGEPLLLLRELAETGAHCAACDLSHLPPLDAIDPLQGYLGWTFSVPADVAESTVREIFDFVGEDCGLTMGAGADLPPPRIEPRTPPAQAEVEVDQPASHKPQSVPAAAAPGQTIRIELDKLDKLIDSVGELIIAQAMLSQQMADKGMSANEELVMVEGLTRDIQESSMAIRAQPIGTVFSRVPRILRELTDSTGKQVKLEVSGEATELDKTVIERLGEPLTHLIRNAVDHGIESAEERLAAGKPPEGTLCLSAEQRSGRIVIRLSDDGRGIDRSRVFAKAVEKGLISADAQLTSEEVDNLIFAPGFSTAEAVSNISGRGVGMDVVRQNVKELRGRITIESEQGKGTAFTLTLPLTMAISDGMIVVVGDQSLVLPLANIVECLRPAAHEVQGLGTGQQMLNARGKFIPIIPVCQAIGADICLPSAEHGVLIVVDTEASGQAALLVDSIRDQRQFVIKSIGADRRTANATILGDGRVALILDVERLVAGNIASSRLKAAA